MREYRTTGTVRVNCGYIGLDRNQADARAGSINSVPGKKGLYEVVRPIEFKAGEKVRLEKPDKAILAKMDLLEKEQGMAAETTPKADNKNKPLS